GLSRSADVDDRNTAREFPQGLLQFLAIVIAGRLFDLTTDLGNPALDIGFFAFAFHDGGVLLVNGDAFGTAEVFELDVLELDAEVFADQTPAGQHGDVFEHRLTTVAEAGRFHRADLQCATQFVYDQGRERFAFHVLRNDEERPASFRDFLEQRKQVLQARDFLLVNENVRIFEHGFHRLRVGHEIGRQITFVELHALDHFQRGLDRFGFLDRDRAVLANFVHRVGNDLADRLVPVGRNGRDLCDLGAIADFLGEFLQFLDDCIDTFHDAALQRSRVRAGSDVAQTFAVNGFRKNGRRGRAVTRDVRSFGSDFANELRTHIFIRVFQLDLFRDRHAVLGDRRAAEFLV